MRLRLTNARIVDADGVRTGSVFIENGMIVPDGGTAAETRDLGGLSLMPALIDLHTHLRDPGWPEKETMETGMRAAAAGGFGTLTAMANTSPVCSTPELVLANQRKAEKLGLCRLVQAAAAGENLGDETPTDRAALAGVTRVLTNDGKTIFSDAFMRGLLQDSETYGFLISTHCQPERATVARDLALLREVGGHLHVGHISCRETVDRIRAAKAEGLRVTCEVTPHHLFGWDSEYRVNPPLRTHDDVLALLEGVRDGTIDCLSTDHAPHTPLDKRNGMAGISNIDYALAVWMRVFHDGGIPLSRLSEMASKNPGSLLGVGAKRIASGEPADLIAVDPDAVWILREEDMRSRSHNTPFFGREVRGRVHMTMIGGRIVYDHGQIGC